jgi:hypothetical protein
MVKIETLAEELQKVMAQRYDKEFNEMRFFIDSAYENGLADGKEQAKSEIINLINGGK